MRSQRAAPAVLLGQAPFLGRCLLRHYADSRWDAVLQRED